MAPELGLLLLADESEPEVDAATSARPRRYALPRRQALGLALVFMILMAGRLVRSHLLLDVDGRWRDPLWLDGLVTPVESAAAAGADRRRKPKLTAPLPINTCSVDSLTLLPGVGKVLAGRIEAIRATGVVFTCPDDLEQVKGIGPAMSAKLTPHVVFASAAHDSTTSEQSR